MKISQASSTVHQFCRITNFYVCHERQLMRHTYEYRSTVLYDKYCVVRIHNKCITVHKWKFQICKVEIY